MGLKKLGKIFKRKMKTRPVESHIALLLQTNDKNTVPQISLVLKLWKTQLSKGRKSANTFTFNDQSTRSNIKVYFTLYEMERFLKFYRERINENVVVPHTDGGVLHDAHADLYLYYYSSDPNKTNSKGQEELDSTHLLDTYKNAPVISSNFTSILVLVYRLLFFYNYDRADLANNKDPKAEYSKNKKIADYICGIYVNENSSIKSKDSNVLAKYPSQDDFDVQNISSVYIPAFSTKGLKNQATYIKTPVTATTTKSRKAKADRKNKKSTESGSSAKSSNANGSTDFYAQFANDSSKTSSKSTSAQSSSAGVANSVARIKANASHQASSRVTSASPQSSSSHSSAVRSKAPQRQAPSSNKSYRPRHARHAKYTAPVVRTKTVTVTRPTKRQKALEQSYMHGDLIDVSKFQKDYFPLTNKPKVVETALQLLLKDDPDIFHHRVKFQTFDIDPQLANPTSLQQALKTGKMDNQKYVLQIDNQWKKSANELIKGRQDVLNLSYTRLLINLVNGAYTQLDRQISGVLAKSSDDRPLLKSVQNYYDAHWNKQLKQLKNDRDVQKKSIKKSLHEEFLGKLHREYARIDQGFNNNVGKVSDQIDHDSQDIFYRERDKRDDRVDKSVKDLKKSSISKLRRDKKNFIIEFKHKANSASNLLFTFLNRKLHQNHVKALNTVSQMIQNQVELDNSKERLSKARAEASHNRGNAKTKAVINNQKRYISDLRSQYDDMQGKLSDISFNSQSVKSRLNRAVTKNRTLTSKLNNANRQIIDTYTTLQNNRKSIAKYKHERDVNRQRTIDFENKQNSLRADKRDLAHRDSVRASKANSKASVSASAKIARHDSAVDKQNQSYQHTINSLKVASMNANGNNQSVTNELADYKQKYQDLQVSNSINNSVRSDEENKRHIKQVQGYQSTINNLLDEQQNASSATADYEKVANALSDTRRQFSSFRASVSSSNASASSSASTSNSQYKATMNNEPSYETSDSSNHSENTSEPTRKPSSSKPKDRSKISFKARSGVHYSSHMDAAEKAEMESQDHLKRQLRREHERRVRAEKQSNNQQNSHVPFWEK